MNPTKNFKMPTSTKALIAGLPSTDTHQRGAFKRMMIQGQLQGAVRLKAEKKKDWVTGTPSTEVTTTA
jgi:hypothetical protein